MGLSAGDVRMGLEKLVGARVIAAAMEGDNLMLMTDRGLYKLEPEGDCCSHCYIQHISGTDALAPGAVIASVENIDVAEIPERDAFDVSDTWGHRLTTDRGHCSIEMRLDHNGYYGGWLNVTVRAGWPKHVHDDCKELPEMMIACGCFGKPLDDF